MKIREPAPLIIALLLGMLIGSYFNSDRLFVAALAVITFFSIEMLLLRYRRSTSTTAVAPKKRTARFAHLSIGFMTVSALIWSLSSSSELLFHCFFISTTLAYLAEAYAWPTEGGAGKNHDLASKPDISR